MDLIFYNNLTNNVSPIDEVSFLPPNLLMADTVCCDSFISGLILMIELNEKIPDEDIIRLFDQQFKDIEETRGDIEHVKRILPDVKNLKKIKHKDKNVLACLGLYNSHIRDFRRLLKFTYTDISKKLHLFEIIPFYDKKVFMLSYGENDKAGINEKKFLTKIADALIYRQKTFSLTNHIETFFPFQTITSPETDDCGFIKMPLWKFPFIVNTPFEHINYTREQLQPVLQAFKGHLKELQTEFFGIDFVPENFHQIEQYIIEKMIPLISPVQDAIDDNIYLSKLKNNSPENSGLVFCLGISSAETIVNYYEKNEIIEAFEANEINLRIARHIDLKSTYIFTYFEVHNPG